jgi:hypothetical protein
MSSADDRIERQQITIMSVAMIIIATIAIALISVRTNHEPDTARRLPVASELKLCDESSRDRQAWMLCNLRYERMEIVTARDWNLINSGESECVIQKITLLDDHIREVVLGNLRNRVAPRCEESIHLDTTTVVHVLKFSCPGMFWSEVNRGLPDCILFLPGRTR